MGYDSWLSFRLGSARHAVRLERVHEVVEPSALTRLPLAPRAVLGVLDLRGTPLPVLDLGLRLGGRATPRSRFSCVLVVDGPAGPLGLLVDRVDGVIDLPAGLRGETRVSGVDVRLLELDELRAEDEGRAPAPTEGMES
jgi:chemotaxis signal transduction protein